MGVKSCTGGFGVDSTWFTFGYRIVLFTYSRCRQGLTRGFRTGPISTDNIKSYGPAKKFIKKTYTIAP